MSEHEVEMRLGYTPCICGVLDGTWHPDCYQGKTKSQIKSGYQQAIKIARAHLLTQDALRTHAAIEKARK